MTDRTEREGPTYADGRYLVLPDGSRLGPFSSHWAACAAMVRRSDPTFVSLGGDMPSDLAIEAGRPTEALAGKGGGNV